MSALHTFVRLAWPQVEPARSFQDNWHIGAICEHLEAVTRGEVTRLVINVPPGSMKSLSACVFWPAWVWTFRPETKWIYASYSDSLSVRDNLRTRRLVESDWYQNRWGDVFRPNPDEWRATKFSNDRGGMRMATSVAGTVTGEHADVQVVDDPLKPREVTGAGAVSRAALNECWEWWRTTMATRLVEPSRSARVIIMQRLHEDDLAGHVLREGGYEHLCLPMEYETASACRTSVVVQDTGATFADPRCEEGELLWPDRFSAEAVASRKRELGSMGWAAQDQQRPAPAEGAVFKAEWLRYYRALPPGPGRVIQSWDCTFKGTDTSDWVVGQVWKVIGGGYYLVDQVRARMGFSETLAAVRSLSALHPNATRKLVEDKANGPAVIDMLRKDVPGLVAVNPQGGKEARANAVAPLWESGNVYLPDPSIAPWVTGFVDELLAFPSGRHDDQVDAMTQALLQLYRQSVGKYEYRPTRARQAHPGALL